MISAHPSYLGSLLAATVVDGFHGLIRRPLGMFLLTASSALYIYHVWSTTIRADGSNQDDIYSGRSANRPDATQRGLHLARSNSYLHHVGSL